jgi:energy-converting hydrogenase Eha subunit E
MPGVFLGVIGSLVVALALGQLPHSHPIIPSLNFTFPGSGNTLGHKANGTISLPTGVAVGSFLTLHGDLPSGETGTVTVEGAYDQGEWRVLASVPVADDSYEARFPVNQPGLLQIRVTYPDGHRSVGETQVG